METFGRHLLVEYRGCRPAALDDKEQLERLMRTAAEEAGATIIQAILHQFSPQGVSGVVVVEESHLSIHTWPERGYAAVDFYTCGDCVPTKAHEVLIRGLEPKEYQVLTIHRGLEVGAMHVVADVTARTNTNQAHQPASTQTKDEVST